jgi:hypothetical protein
LQISQAGFGSWAVGDGCCYSPMQSGLLTDSVTADRLASLAGDDWRRRAPEFQEPTGAGVGPAQATVAQ